MKVIDLFVKIVNEEEVPRHIKYLDNDYYYNNDDGVYYRAYTSSQLISDIDYFSELNDEIEIIDESKNYEFEKIEKLGFIYNNTYGNRSQHRKSEEPLINAINQLIENQNKIIEKINEKSNLGGE